MKDATVEDGAVGARNADVPRYSHLIAVAAGLFGLPFIYALADFVAGGLLGDFLAGFEDVSYTDVLPYAVFFAAAYAVLGAVFGLAWPEKTWRWGVWLCALPLCLVSFIAGGAWGFLAWVAVTLLPACLGAYVAGRFHLKYVAVDESG